MTRIVGIDLGTTNSLCSVFEDGTPRLIPNAHGSLLTPSVVGVLPDGQIIVGESAREMRVTKPDATASRFKRYMGTNRTIRIGDRTFTAPELSSFVLRSLKGDAESYFDGEVSDAVITVPAYFNDNQRKATKVAGELAGFRVRRIINEPTAAALTYGFHERNAEKHLFVIDLGGGTFDVTLMEVFEGNLEIIATSGENFLGGEDFTDRLAAAALNKTGGNLEVAELKEPERVARLREECEQAKRLLAEQDSAGVRMPNTAGEFDDSPPVLKVSRSAFAKLSEPLTQRLMGPISKALRDAEVQPTDIDEVILVGGATRMTVLHDFVEEVLKQKPQAKFNPDEVVALGASVQAALIDDDRAVDDMVMTDVCPHTLGVEVAKQFGNQDVGGFFAPVIHRNTTIPVSREESFSTSAQNQYEVAIRVFQGESRKTKDNLLLGEVTIEDIPPGPAGTEIRVRFTYDLNGILEVEAVIPSSGQKVTAVLTQQESGLSDGEVAAAVEKMQALKFYPRDDIENQRLINFCERAVGEMNQHQREQLEAALDFFESALNAGDRQRFEHARDGLLILLAQLGLDYEMPDEPDNEL